MKRMHLYIGGAAGMIALLAVLGAWFERISAKSEVAKQQAEAKRKANWIANFPFQPTPHPTLKFDPEVLKYELDERGIPIRDEHYWEMVGAKDRHGYLKTMYEDHEREMYSPEFEKMHNILSESGIEADPHIWGRVFAHLVHYHMENSHDPEAMSPNPNVTTWAEETAITYESLLGTLISKKGMGDPKPTPLLSEEEAMILRDRLIAELPAEVMLQHRPIIPHYKYQDALKAGDALLIR